MSLNTTYLFLCREIVLELTIVPNSAYSVWSSWETALFEYSVAFDEDQLEITPLGGKFWDIPFPHIVVDSDTSDDGEADKSESVREGQTVTRMVVAVDNEFGEEYPDSDMDSAHGGLAMDFPIEGDEVF